jgi:hypothetical protein
MERFEYKITKHSSDTFEKIIYFCSESGQCGINEVSKDQTRILTDGGGPKNLDNVLSSESA